MGKEQQLMVCVITASTSCMVTQPHHRKHPCTLVQFHGPGVMSYSLLLYVYVHAKRALKQFFVKCTFLVLFESLFHTADDDTIVWIIGATIYVLQVFV